MITFFDAFRSRYTNRHDLIEPGRKQKMFWKEKRIEKKLEKQILQRERELGNSPDKARREALLNQLASLSQERGHHFKAQNALIERFKLNTNLETLTDLVDYLERTSQTDSNRLVRALSEAAGNIESPLWESLLQSVARINRENALEISISAFQIHKKRALGESAVHLLEESLLEASRVDSEQLRKKYLDLTGELFNVFEREDAAALLGKCVRYARAELGDLELSFILSVNYLEKFEGAESAEKIINELIGDFNECVSTFGGQRLLDLSEPLLELTIERDSKEALLREMLALARRVSDKRESVYAERLFKIAGEKTLKREVFELEKLSRGSDLARSYRIELASAYRRLIEISQERGEKIMHIRKLGALLRDKLNDYDGALEVFQAGIELESNDIVLWLAKGVTLEKLARNQTDPLKAKACWKRTYDLYFEVARRFDEQEVKLSAIEKCSRIGAENFSQVGADSSSERT